MSCPSAPGHVETELTYWKPRKDRSITTDFTAPGAQEKFRELQENETSYPIRITDVRGCEHEYSLNDNGFQYVSHDVPDLIRCTTEQETADVLLPGAEELVKGLLGAARVVTFAHRIRMKIADSSQGRESRAPAHSVHSDFTVDGALHQLENVIIGVEEREQLKKGRFYIVNVWWPLKTITRDPLTVCDWLSCDPEKDWISNRFQFQNDWNELGAIKFNKTHRWYYLSRQRPSEPLIFLQFDSDRAAEGGMTLAHSAFVDPKYTNDAPRESMEIKMFAFLAEA